VQPASELTCLVSGLLGIPLLLSGFPRQKLEPYYNFNDRPITNWGINYATPADVQNPLRPLNLLMLDPDTGLPLDRYAFLFKTSCRSIAQIAGHQSKLQHRPFLGMDPVIKCLNCILNGRHRNSVLRGVRMGNR
jgi:hypothetical protein